MNLRRALRDRRHARLLGAARRGDPEAFRTLYRELFPPVMGYLSLRLSVREDVEDLASTTFHRLLEHLDEYDASRGSVLAWTLTIAHHALVDHVRRARIQPPHEAADVLHPSRSDDPLDRLLRDERSAALEDAIGSLEPEAKRMFELRYRLDMSYREIAEVLASSEAAIKQRFSRTHRRLRATIEDRSEGRP